MNNKFICIKLLDRDLFTNSIFDIKVNQIIKITFYNGYFEIISNDKSLRISSSFEDTFMKSFLDLNKYRELTINKILEDESIS